MQIHISPTDGVPIYLQIVNQIKYLVSSGRLAAGEELPPIRTLAEKLLVNPNTVARAYRELELAGIVLKRRTTGTYVSGVGTRLGRRDRVKIVTRRIDALLAEAGRWQYRSTSSSSSCESGMRSCESRSTRGVIYGDRNMVAINNSFEWRAERLTGDAGNCRN